MTNYFLNQIDIKLDNYYLNPYTLKLNNDYLNLCLKNNDLITYNNCDSNIENNNNNNNNENNENIENIIKTLTSIILSNNSSITNNYNHKQNNLFVSITNSNIKELNYILSNNNININIQDNDGDTPLHISVFLCNYEACSILLFYGALLNIKDKRGQIPIHRICFCYDKPDIERVIDLFDFYQKKINLKTSIFNHVDIYGNTALHLILNYFIKNQITIDDKNINIINKLKFLTDNKIVNKNNHTVLDLINILYVINI